MTVAMLPYAIRRAPLPAFATVAVIGGASSAVRAATGGTTESLLPWMRLTVVMLAAAAAVAVSDPADTLTVTTPIGRARTRLLSVLLAGATCVTLLALTGALASVVADGATDVPIGGLLVELIALCCVGWTLCAVIAEVEGHQRAGPRAATGLVLLAVLSLMSPRLRHALWVGPGPEWRTSHIHWALIAVGATVALAAISSDPLNRSTVRHR